MLVFCGSIGVIVVGVFVCIGGISVDDVGGVGVGGVEVLL